MFNNNHFDIMRARETQAECFDVVNYLKKCNLESFICLQFIFLNSPFIIILILSPPPQNIIFFFINANSDRVVGEEIETKMEDFYHRQFSMDLCSDCVNGIMNKIN